MSEEELIECEGCGREIGDGEEVCQGKNNEELCEDCAERENLREEID